jgi:hypothetical protein
MHSPTTDAQQHLIDQSIDQAPAPDLESALPKLLRADPDGARSRAYLQTHLHHPAMADADHLACAALIVRELEQRRLAALTPRLSDAELAHALRQNLRWQSPIATDAAIERLAHSMDPDDFEALLQRDDLTAALAEALAPATGTAPADAPAPTDHGQETR